jgi:hypothetical protein
LQSNSRYHEHDVEDDVVDCETIQVSAKPFWNWILKSGPQVLYYKFQDEKCEDVTQGYTTEKKCTKWPRQVCKTEKKKVKKYSPETDCKKVPRELCGPSGCVLSPGPEECFDKKETVIQEVIMI